MVLEKNPQKSTGHNIVRTLESRTTVRTEGIMRNRPKENESI